MPVLTLARGRDAAPSGAHWAPRRHWHRSPPPPWHRRRSASPRRSSCGRQAGSRATAAARTTDRRAARPGCMARHDCRVARRGARPRGPYLDPGRPRRRRPASGVSARYRRGARSCSPSHRCRARSGLVLAPQLPRNDYSPSDAALGSTRRRAHRVRRCPRRRGDRRRSRCTCAAPARGRSPSSSRPRRWRPVSQPRGPHRRRDRGADDVFAEHRVRPRNGCGHRGPVATPGEAPARARGGRRRRGDLSSPRPASRRGTTRTPPSPPCRLARPTAIAATTCWQARKPSAGRTAAAHKELPGRDRPFLPRSDAAVPRRRSTPSERRHDDSPLDGSAGSVAADSNFVRARTALVMLDLHRGDSAAARTLLVEWTPARSGRAHVAHHARQNAARSGRTGRCARPAQP